MTTPKELVIDRARWLRGELDSMLLRPRDQKMCCLGFLGLACGYEPDRIRGLGTPKDCADDMWPSEVLDEEDDDLLIVQDSFWTDRAIDINDCDAYSEARREAELIAHFAKIGITLTFTG